MKSAEEIMNILNAYDLTGSLRDAGEPAGCSHHTVANYVARRVRGRGNADGSPTPAPPVPNHRGWRTPVRLYVAQAQMGRTVDEGRRNVAAPPGENLLRFAVGDAHGFASACAGTGGSFAATGSRYITG